MKLDIYQKAIQKIRNCKNFKELDDLIKSDSSKQAYSNNKIQAHNIIMKKGIEWK